MTVMKVLKITLQGPLQSWGMQSRWDSRGTSNAPSKSGVIGLLGCCLGLPRGSSGLGDLDRALHYAVRIDRPGILMTDFHTVQAPNGGMLLNSQGKKRSQTLLTPKQYLQDAAFTVFLWGDEAVLEKCAGALRHPVWPPYLGRRGCVPSVPILPEIFDAESIESAVCSGADHNCPVEIELLPGEALKLREHLINRPDGVINAERNRYYSRPVRTFTLQVR